MRKCLENNRWAAVAVALLLLFATSGMALSRMTCLLGGHTVVSLGTTTDCCPEDEAASNMPTVSGACCALSLAQGTDDPYLGNDDAGFAPLLVVLGNAPVQLLDTAPAAIPEHRESRPPPMDAPERLAVLSTFLI